MINSLVLVASLVFTFGAVILAWKYYGENGLYCMSAIIPVVANIEVLILIKAFGMEQTLGNILFGASFLITDILSECKGKKAANKAVWLGVFSSLFFVAISQSWFLYQPSENDWAMPLIHGVFENTPRLILASLLVYLISQKFDVFMFHKWWQLTEKLSGNKHKYLWLRNNGSTLLSQAINSLLFVVIAFYGVYDMGTIISIALSTYIIYVVIALLDTPIVYFARRIFEKQQERQNN